MLDMSIILRIVRFVVDLSHQDFSLWQQSAIFGDSSFCRFGAFNAFAKPDFYERCQIVAPSC